MMNKHMLVALAAGAAIGYFLRANIKNLPLLNKVYTMGANAA